MGSKRRHTCRFCPVLGGSTAPLYPHYKVNDWLRPMLWLGGGCFAFGIPALALFAPNPPTLGACFLMFAFWLPATFAFAIGVWGCERCVAKVWNW